MWLQPQTTLLREVTEVTAPHSERKREMLYSLDMETRHDFQR